MTEPHAHTHAEIPIGIKFVDLGEDSTCDKCKSRYCSCRERQDGTWENDLPVQLIGEERMINA